MRMQRSVNHHLIPRSIRQELVAPHELQLGPMASGGLSGAWIWHCQSPRGPVALRGWPAVHPTPERLRQIHSAMRRAREQGLETVPSILGNRQGSSFVSDGQRLWELTQWMPGAADYLQAPSTERLQSALQALAKLHMAWRTTADRGAPHQWVHCNSNAGDALDVLQAPSPTVAERRQKLEFSLQQQVAWRDRVFGSSASQTLPVAAPHEAAITALARQTLMHLAAVGPELLPELSELEATPVQLHFVLRDVWSDHVLFTEDRVTGIIDFGAARVDEPATDVARLLGSLEPLDAARWLIGWEAYQAHNPHVDLHRVRVLDRVGTLLAAVQWLQWLVVEPRQFNAPLQQLLQRWQRLLLRVEAG